jgi:hypothetical protein
MERRFGPSRQFELRPGHPYVAERSRGGRDWHKNPLR